MNNNQMNRERIPGDRVRIRIELMINRMAERMLNEIESRVVDLLSDRLPDLVMDSFPTILDDLMERLENEIWNRMDAMESRIMNRYRESMREGQENRNEQNHASILF